MDKKTQYCQNLSSPQLDQKIQWDPNQNSSKFVGTYKLILKFIWRSINIQNNQHSKNNQHSTEEKKQTNKKTKSED